MCSPCSSPETAALGASMRLQRLSIRTQHLPEFADEHIHWNGAELYTVQDSSILNLRSDFACRWQASALDALLEACQDFLVGLFGDAIFCQAHGNRKPSRRRT